MITRSNGVQWLWWLRRAKEQCCGLGYSSKLTKQGDGRAWRKGHGGAGKKGRWPGYSTRPKSSKESWPEALAKQARSLGRKIGWASKESRPDSLVEQWTRVRVRIFSVLDLFELSSENPAVCWHQDAVEWQYTGSSWRPMLDLQECIYLSWHESVKIQQYVGIKFGKDVANEIKYSPRRKRQWLSQRELRLAWRRRWSLNHEIAAKWAC